ncbi:MAG TPA: NADH dehydrogenase (quinone) subunit D [Gemmatimonadaceae bacterium]|jgi:NADH-quinone oxidoreductase subunit D|nr:NADH dehydrogenase (quinone) subunit D [Gemmatimonadaceae bacterium]
MASGNRTVEVELSTTGLDAQGRPQRIPLVTKDGGAPLEISAPPSMEPELFSDHMLINIGPQHPATHGVLRLVLELDGETVVRCIPHIGYLHCGFEKIGEYRQYNQIIPWTDREDYLNSIGNNVAFALGAERLFGIDITERCQVLRVIASELSRIISHLVWVGTTCIDIGAYTPFLWSFQERERVYDLLEAWVGARLTTSATRVGGMAADIPSGWMDGLRSFLRTFPNVIEEVDRILTKNGIWVGRTIGLGVMTPDEATNWGLSGPMLRASGVDYDVRKDFPYLGYETYDFDVPVGTNGDVYDRYLVRMEEMRQSVRILKQAADRLPDGPVNVDDARVILPPKSKATSEMESMIHHFKQVMEGPRPPAGEAYVAVESPKGEKGYYMVSDGTSKPVRWRIRPPAFVNLSAIPKMVEGHLLSDVIAINASIDIVMGEIDR